MIYLDTSVVVALLTREEHSPVALKWLEQCREPLISSDWLITETHSALGIKQRHHGLTPQARLPQAVGRKPHRQAVAPAADGLMEVPVGISRSVLGLGLRQGTARPVKGPA